MGKKKTGWRVLLIISIIIFLVAAIMLTVHLFPKVNEPILPGVSSSAPTSSIPLAENPINFDEQKSKNNEIEAWISVPNTNINYPVLQSYTTNENFYIDHDVDGNSKSAGAIYIQKGNSKDFSDRVTVIYGHNMKNRTMFGSLKDFRFKENFFEDNSKFYVYTPGHILTYEIYSAFVYDDRHILNSFDFNNDEQFSDFISQTLNPKTMTKKVREGVKVDTDDKLVVLSTCTGIKTERYLVVGVLVDDQPTY